MLPGSLYACPSTQGESCSTRSTLPFLALSLALRSLFSNTLTVGSQDNETFTKSHLNLEQRIGTEAEPYRLPGGYSFAPPAARDEGYEIMGPDNQVIVLTHPSGTSEYHVYPGVEYRTDDSKGRGFSYCPCRTWAVLTKASGDGDSKSSPSQVERLETMWEDWEKVGIRFGGDNPSEFNQTHKSEDPVKRLGLWKDHITENTIPAIRGSTLVDNDGWKLDVRTAKKTLWSHEGHEGLVDGYQVDASWKAEES